VVGDTTGAAVRALAERYFAPLAPASVPVVVPTAEVEPPGQRRVEVVYDAQPQISIGFLGPPCGDADEFALDVASEILSRGRTGRLYRDLVAKRQLAATAFSFNFTRRLGNLFVVGGTPRGPLHDARELEAALFEHLDRLKATPVAADELARAINGLEADFIRALRDDAGVAMRLGMAEALTGSWKEFDERARWRAVTPEAIMAVARRYFTRRNSAVATLVNPAAGAPSRTPRPVAPGALPAKGKSKGKPTASDTGKGAK